MAVHRLREWRASPGVSLTVTLALVVLFAAVVVGWLYWRQGRAAPLVVSGFVEADQIRVGSRVGGRVTEVLVSEGQRVSAGQVLYRIDPFDLRQQWAASQAELARAEAEHARLKAGYRPEEVSEARARRDQAAAVLSKLKAGPRRQEIEIARARVASAKAALTLAESEHARLTRLSRDAQAAQIELERVVRALKQATADATAAEQELSLLEEGTRKEDIAGAEAALAGAEAALSMLERGYRVEDVARAAAAVDAARAQAAAIEVRLGELTVTSPAACVVEAIDLHPGDLVTANAPSVTLIDDARLWVRTYVPQARLDAVRLGGPTRVSSVVGGAGRFEGRVTFIATEAEFTPRNVQTPQERGEQVFRIKVTLNDATVPLRVGTAVDVHFDSGER